MIAVREADRVLAAIDAGVGTVADFHVHELIAQIVGYGPHCGWACLAVDDSTGHDGRARGTCGTAGTCVSRGACGT